MENKVYSGDIEDIRNHVNASSSHGDRVFCVDLGITVKKHVDRGRVCWIGDSPEYPKTFGVIVAIPV